MEKTLDEKLLSPTQSYNSFADWEKEFTEYYLKNHPKKTKNDLLYDRDYNIVRNKVYGKFVALKNGTEHVEEESHASKSYWKWRDELDKSLAIENEGKTPSQIINESIERTRAKIKSEKQAEQKESKDRVSALRAIYNVCNPLPSDRFKNSN